MSANSGQTIPARNIKLVVAYNGANYHGWQKQADGVDTIQQQIEQAASRLLGHSVVVYGASRTDAGVHALGQVANFFTTNYSIPVQAFCRALNSMLPGDIAIISAEQVDNDFHASRCAIAKTYQYRIFTAPVKPVHLHNLIYHYWQWLDVEVMQEAARRLVGEHDFRGFTCSAEARQNTVRTIYRCEVCQRDSEIIVSITGNGFLYKMVRNIVGTLIEIGRGHWQPDRIDKIISSRNRSDAGPTAPAEGLYLVSVKYPPK